MNFQFFSVGLQLQLIGKGKGRQEHPGRKSGVRAQDVQEGSYRMFCRIIYTELGMLGSVSQTCQSPNLNGSKLVQSGWKPML
jgi:hypothetical protein